MQKKSWETKFCWTKDRFVPACEHTLLHDIKLDLMVFFKLVDIYMYDDWIAFLHCPAPLCLKQNKIENYILESSSLVVFLKIQSWYHFQNPKNRKIYFLILHCVSKNSRLVLLSFSKKNIPRENGNVLKTLSLVKLLFSCHSGNQGFACHVFWKLRFKEKHLFWSLSFNESCRLMGFNFMEKRLQYSYFPVNCAQLLRMRTSYNTANGSLWKHVNESMKIMRGLYKLIFSTNKMTIRNVMWIDGKKLLKLR